MYKPYTPLPKVEGVKVVRFEDFEEDLRRELGVHEEYPRISKLLKSIPVFKVGEDLRSLLAQYELTDYLHSIERLLIKMHILPEILYRIDCRDREPEWLVEEEAFNIAKYLGLIKPAETKGNYVELSREGELIASGIVRSIIEDNKEVIGRILDTTSPLIALIGCLGILHCIEHLRACINFYELNKNYSYFSLNLTLFPDPKLKRILQQLNIDIHVVVASRALVKLPRVAMAVSKLFTGFKILGLEERSHYGSLQCIAPELAIYIVNKAWDEVSPNELMNIVKDINKLIAVAKMRHQEYYVGTVEFDRLLISLGLTIDDLRQLLEEMRSNGITSKLSTIPESRPFIILKEKRSKNTYPVNSK